MSVGVPRVAPLTVAAAAARVRTQMLDGPAVSLVGRVWRRYVIASMHAWWGRRAGQSATAGAALFMSIGRWKGSLRVAPADRRRAAAECALVAALSRRSCGQSR